MGVDGKRGCYSLAFLAMLILLNASRCTSTTMKSDSLMSDRLLADDMEVEFMMDSEISRMLAPTIRLTEAATNSGKPVANCGRPSQPNQPYISCTTSRNRNKIGENCNYPSNNRAC